MIDRAEEFARLVHQNQTYDGGDYVDNHNFEVIRTLERFGYVGDRWTVLGLLHDVMEDIGDGPSPEQREDCLGDKFGRDIAEIVHQVSGFGHNRKTRNAYMYSGVKSHEAKILKMADRLVNIRGPKRDMYVREIDAFMEVFGGADSRMDAELLSYRITTA